MTHISFGTYGQKPAKIHEDMERGKRPDAREVKAYGIVDRVIKKL